MDPSVLGTGQLVLSRASAAPIRLPVQVPLPPGCGNGGCIPPVGSSCVVQGVSIDPQSLFLILSWAPPSGSPADLPLVFTYKSDSSNSTEFGTSWSAPYHRFALPNARITPHPVTVNTPELSLLLRQPRHLVFNRPPPRRIRWSATQPPAGPRPSPTARASITTIRAFFAPSGTGPASAGPSPGTVPSTLCRPSRRHSGRRTSFVYNASSFVRRIVDPGGRITTLTVNANSDLSQIVSPAAVRHLIHL